MLTPKTNCEIKMRQVAVHPAYSRKGVGRALVMAAEEYASRAAFHAIVLNARETAVDFYLGLGYSRIGSCFLEVGIPHFFMKKDLK